MAFRDRGGREGGRGGGREGEVVVCLLTVAVVARGERPLLDLTLLLETCGG